MDVQTHHRIARWCHHGLPPWRWCFVDVIRPLVSNVSRLYARVGMGITMLLLSIFRIIVYMIYSLCQCIMHHQQQCLPRRCDDTQLVTEVTDRADNGAFSDAADFIIRFAWIPSWTACQGFRVYFTSGTKDFSSRTCTWSIICSSSDGVQTWCPAPFPLLAITCSTNEPLPRILQWIRYHQLLGFSLFYFFVEGHAQDPEVVNVLRALVGVKVRQHACDKHG